MFAKCVDTWDSGVVQAHKGLSVGINVWSWLISKPMRIMPIGESKSWGCSREECSWPHFRYDTICECLYFNYRHATFFNHYETLSTSWSQIRISVWPDQSYDGSVKLGITAWVIVHWKRISEYRYIFAQSCSVGLWTQVTVGSLLFG